MKRRKQYDEGNKIETIKQRAIKKKVESLHHKHKNVGLEGEKTSVRAFLLHILWIVSHMAIKHTEPQKTSL